MLLRLLSCTVFVLCIRVSNCAGSNDSKSTEWKQTASLDEWAQVWSHSQLVLFPHAMRAICWPGWVYIWVLCFGSHSRKSVSRYDTVRRYRCCRSDVLVWRWGDAESMSSMRPILRLHYFRNQYRADEPNSKPNPNSHLPEDVLPQAAVAYKE